jgi:hypothetical protein
MKQGEDIDCLICNPNKSEVNYIVGTKNDNNNNNIKHDKPLIKDNKHNSSVNQKYQDDLTKLAHVDKYFLNANQIHF